MNHRNDIMILPVFLPAKYNINRNLEAAGGSAFEYVSDSGIAG